MLACCEMPNGHGLEAVQDRFNLVNAILVNPTRELLDRVVAVEADHPKLMNTLSMLEHMGSHKIMATQHGAHIDEATLRHLTEECHHAFFMKRQAEKAAQRPLEYGNDDLLAPVAARMYFQRLEASMLKTLDSERSRDATYLYMSMIVELRAIWFYTLYQRALNEHSHPLSLKRLLGEELNHLTEMAERIAHADERSNARIDSFVLTEHALYGRFLASLQHAIN